MNGLSQLEERVAVDVFKADVVRWAEKIGVEPREIHVRDMTRKWASCFSRGRLTFDIDLLRQPLEFRDEVIVHELLHLKLPNHGRLFRNLLRSYLAGAKPGLADSRPSTAEL